MPIDCKRKTEKNGEREREGERKGEEEEKKRGIERQTSVTETLHLYSLEYPPAKFLPEKPACKFDLSTFSLSLSLSLSLSPQSTIHLLFSSILSLFFNCCLQINRANLFVNYNNFFTQGLIECTDILETFPPLLSPFSPFALAIFLCRTYNFMCPVFFLFSLIHSLFHLQRASVYTDISYI